MNQTIKEKLNQKPLRIVYVVKTIMNQFIKVNDSNSPDINEAQAFSTREEAEKYVNSRMFPMFLSVAKVNLVTFYDEDIILEPFDSNPNPSDRNAEDNYSRNRGK